jgi:hypothetical protein
VASTNKRQEAPEVSRRAAPRRSRRERRARRGSSSWRVTASSVVDVGARTSERLEFPQLRPGDPPYRIVRRANRLVLYGGDTYALDLDLRSPEKLGQSWFFIPSSKPDRVWLARLDPESPETVRALESVREVTVEGRVTVPEVVPLGGRWPVGAVDDALVFESKPGGLEAWDPRTGEVTRRLPGAAMGTTHGAPLAWCDASYETLHVTDVLTGEARAIAPPEGFVAFDCWSGAFSPDSTLLAVPVTGGDEVSRQSARSPSWTWSEASPGRSRDRRASVRLHRLGVHRRVRIRQRGRAVRAPDPRVPSRRRAGGSRPGRGRRLLWDGGQLSFAED